VAQCVNHEFKSQYHKKRKKKKENTRVEEACEGRRMEAVGATQGPRAGSGD
jgi:hypothetical protein